MQNVYLCNSINSLVEATVKGVGVAFLPQYQKLKDLIKQNKLLPILPEYQSKGFCIELSFVRQQHISYLHEDCIDFLVEHIRRYALQALAY